MTASPRRVVVRDWLAQQDVSERDETLDAASARVWLLHRALVSEPGEPGDGAAGGGGELARAIARTEGSVAQIAAAVDCEEPRFGVMALVDLLAVLRRREAAEGGGQQAEWALAVRGVAEVVPDVLLVLVRKAGEGDVCGDAMAYTVTLVTFLVGEGREVVECGGEGLWRGVVEAACRVEWLKVCMRVWKDAELSAHVPGVDDRDECHGLGFLVTVFLEAIVAVGGGRSWGGGLGAICGMGVWTVSFVGLRLFGNRVGEDERVRLVDLIWKCVKSDPMFGARLVFEDAGLMRAICQSGMGVGGEEEEDRGSDMSGDVRSVGGDNNENLEAGMEDGVGGAGAAGAIVDSGSQGSACSIEGNDGDRMESVEQNGGADPEELMLAARRGAGVFAHVRLFAQAVREAPGADVRRRRFFRRMGPRPWLWSAAERSAELVYSLAGYELALGERCADFVKAPCARNALSFFVWRAAEWLAVDGAQWRSCEGDVLSRLEILERIASISKTLCDSSAVPLLAECAHGLALAGLERERGTGIESKACEAQKEANKRSSSHIIAQENGVSALKVLDVCEWCLFCNKEAATRLKACGDCRQAFYCSEEHMRAHWRRHHKLTCPAKCIEPFHRSSLRVDASRNLVERSSGVALGAIYAKGGVESVVRPHGALLVSLGLALCISEQGAGVVDVKAVPRGQFVQNILERLNTQGAVDVARAFVDTCSRFNGAFGLVAVHNMEPDTVKLCIYRALGPLPGQSLCGHSGCGGHDVLCSSSFLPTR